MWRLSGVRSTLPKMLYFAFGSNLLPARLLARTPSAVFIRSYCLSGWRLAFHKQGADGSGKGDIVSSSDSRDCVYGAIYRLSAHDKVVLDGIEGLGKGYNESHLVDANTREELFFYVADPSAINPDLKPYTWYHQLVISGARWHRFPEKYISQLTRFESIPDPDPERAEANFSILRSAGLSPK